MSPDQQDKGRRRDQRRAPRETWFLISRPEAPNARAHYVTNAADKRKLAEWLRDVARKLERGR